MNAIISDDGPAEDLPVGCLLSHSLTAFGLSVVPGVMIGPLISIVSLRFVKPLHGLMLSNPARAKTQGIPIQLLRRTGPNLGLCLSKEVRSAVHVDCVREVLSIVVS